MVNQYVYYKSGGEFNTDDIKSFVCFADFCNLWKIKGEKNDLIFIFNPFPVFTKEEVKKVIKSFRGMNIKLKWVKYDKLKTTELLPLVLVPKTNSLAQIKLFYHVIRYFHESTSSVEMMRNAINIKKELKYIHISSLIILLSGTKYTYGHPIGGKTSLRVSSWKYQSYRELLLCKKNCNNIPYYQIYNTSKTQLILEKDLINFIKNYEKNRNS